MKTCKKGHEYDSEEKCCPVCRDISNDSWYARNKEKAIKASLERYHTNKEEIRVQRKESKKNRTPEQKQKSRDRRNAYRREKYANDPLFRLAMKLRVRIQRALKSNKKDKTVKLLGCTTKEARAYLESKFLPGMTWDNYNKYGWHADHIKSIDSYDLTDPEEAKKACRYTNLLPRWCDDNHKKSNKPLIVVVTGAPGAGKSWVAKQLDVTRWNVVDSDVVPKKQLLASCVSTLPTVLFLTIGVSSFMKDDRFHYDLLVINEDLETLKSRVTARGGTVTSTIEKRHKRIQVLKKRAKVSGTSAEILAYLS